MRIRTTLLLAVCGLALAPVGRAMPLGHELVGAAQVGHATDRNAALEYWRLITVDHGGPELIDRVRPVLRAMHPGDDAEVPPVEEPAELKPGAGLAGLLADYDGYFDDVERASRTPVSDFQIRYEDGYAVVMPHLGPLRGIARLMVVDARRLALAGEYQQAAERLAAMLRMGRHITGDRTLISSLVSIAITSLVMEEGLWLLEWSEGDAAVREALVSGVGRFPADDPYNAEAGLRVEQDMVETLARQFSGPKAGQEFLAALSFPTADGADAIVNEVRGMDGAAFKRESERAVDAFDLILEAWRADSPQVALREIERACIEGEHGALAQLVVPSLGKARASVSRAEAELRAFKDRVEGDG